MDVMQFGITCVIPARLGSTRFPRKIFAKLGSKTLLQLAYEAAAEISLFKEVVVAVDAEETREHVESFGGRACMTSVACKSGTDRLIELVQTNQVTGDLFVNWQADEPFVSLQVIETLLQSAGRDGCSVWTLCKRIEEAHSPHLVKVVRNFAGEALYFSRSPIPYYRDANEKIYYKHVGLYAYSREAIEKIALLPVSPLEEAEKLEQLRFLQGGLKIKVHETDQEIFGIDTPEQLESAKLLLGL